MVDAPAWLVYTFDLLIIVIILLLAMFLKAWLDARSNKGKMAIDIREPTGFTDRHPIKPDPDGQTITFDGGVYELTKPPGKDTKELYPRIRFVRYPKNPFLGLSMFQTTMRLEEFQRDNPEPIHPFYGRVDKDGKFIDSQLTVTATEWNAHRSKITAVGIAQDANERAAREKEWQKGMANLPNKMIIYIGIGAILLLEIISLFLQYQG